MGINTVHHTPYSRDLAPCNFWLFPKLRGCRYETIEETKEAVTKVIDTLTQEDFHGAIQKLLSERYNRFIAAGVRLLRGGLEFYVCTINKSAHTKKSENLSTDSRMLKRNHLDINNDIFQGDLLSPLLFVELQYLFHRSFKKLMDTKLLKNKPPILYRRFTMICKNI